jgi:hypothetical protein
MVDSCFKILRKTRCKCLKSLQSHRESIDTFYFTEENKVHPKKCNFATSVTSVDINLINDIDYHDLDTTDENDDSLVVLRPHNRKYHYSVSSTMSALSTEDDNETLDILYPLPHVNTHERSLIDEIKALDKNGMVY